MSGSTLIRNYTLNRNILGGSATKSADRIANYIEVVGEGIDSGAYSRLSKGQTNDISAIAANTGLFQPLVGGGYEPTQLNRSYRTLQSANKLDAWQWLLTRSIWHQEVPNGTASRYNATAKEAGVSFNLFRTIVGLLQLLAALPGNERFLYFTELVQILSDDANWSASPVDLFMKVLVLRQEGNVRSNETFLDGLENRVGAPRDNLNTVFVKAYRQTGLFVYKSVGQAVVGFALSTDLSLVHQRRVRHVLDHKAPGDPQSDWGRFIDEHLNDLPLEVELTTEIIADKEDEDESPKTSFRGEIATLIGQLKDDLAQAGLFYSASLLNRFVASLLAKPFVILTGLSGSGKTKMAEAFAVWLEEAAGKTDPFVPGVDLQSSSAVYRVVEADRVAIVLATARDDGEDKLTTLPRGLIEDWAKVIRDRGLTRETSGKELRELVSASTNHDLHLNGFTSQLKAAAFAIIDRNPVAERQTAYRIVPVGADWNSGEYVLGYPDALSAGTYVRRPSLDIILGAHERAHVPHLLILDEMNLSHVERYFAEVLSAIESGDRIDLYSSASGSRSSVPPFIDRLPKNLSIIGTVNIDETTYMFSPKVLDRANVVEFRIDQRDISDYLSKAGNPDISFLRGKGQRFSSYFDGTFVAPELGLRYKAMLAAELALFFDIMAGHGAEFGFRVAKEVSAFVASYLALTDVSDDRFFEALDAQVLQKLLPKIHGADREVRPLLWAMADLTGAGREWSAGDQPSLDNADALLKSAQGALRSEGADPMQSPASSPTLPLSYNKIYRMLQRLSRLGYVAYAEG